MKETGTTRRRLERLLVATILTLLAIELLLIAPAYASELRLDRLHPALPIVDLRPLARIRDSLTRNVGNGIEAGTTDRAPTIGTARSAIGLLERAVRETPTPMAWVPDAPNPPTQAATRAAPSVTDDGHLSQTATPAPTHTGQAPSTPTQTDAYTPTVTSTGLHPQTFTPTPRPSVLPSETSTPEPTATPPPTSSPTPPLPTATAFNDVQPTFPIRAAFYYPWFPQAWSQAGIDPYTNYEPTLGYYDSGSQSVIRAHIAAMQYGHIDAGIASWWGQGHHTDGRLTTILDATLGSSFRWVVYYEPESLGNPTSDQIASDLAYISANYGGHASYLRVNGRFVVFVYADGGDGCQMAARWHQANSVEAYIVLKVFSGYKACASQPDGWHQYAPANAVDSQAGYSFTISPGFWKVGETPRLERDLIRWAENIQAMVESGAPFQLITSFNEWGEGTSVESAISWESPSGYGAYLDLLHTKP